MEVTELGHMILEEMFLVLALLRFDHQCHTYAKVWDQVEIIMNINIVFIIYSEYTHLILWQSSEVDLISVLKMGKLSLKTT